LRCHDDAGDGEESGRPLFGSEPHPSADDRFFLVNEDVDLTFAKDAQGHVIDMQAVAGGQTVTAKKVK
jgi:hypothetical protein